MTSQAPGSNGNGLLAKPLGVLLPPGLLKAIKDDPTVALSVPLMWALIPVVWLWEVIKARPKD